MKFLTPKQWAAAILAAFISVAAVAQEDELKALPGYVDFGQLDSVYGEPKVRINIGSFLLGFVAAAAKEDPEAAALMRGLEGVRINIYSTAGEVAPAMEHLVQVKSMLQTQNWEPIVQVNEQGEQVQIFMKADGEGMQGLTVMAVNGEEAVFLNILGSIDPDQLGKVMEQFDVDVGIE
jgi:hypothetical protein